MRETKLTRGTGEKDFATDWQGPVTPEPPPRISVPLPAFG
jgi:hypothetical protein